MDKAFMIQKHARENVETVKSYLTDLSNWESEMKRKEAALNGEIEQELPPVRSKAKKDKSLPKIPKKSIDKTRIKSLDYKAWDEFDVDKACAMVDREDRGVPSLDSKTSEQQKLEKLLEESQHEKEKGNQYVKVGKWDEAISCYNRAIELYRNDAIYYANRGLCYLKKDNLHSAEADCTTAISLDPTYVKAYQRRASAREKLGSLRRASEDLVKVIELEPKNLEAKRLLEVLKKKMGTKGSKSKCSPVTTPSAETAKLLSTPLESAGLITKSSCKLTDVEALSIEELNDDELRVITPIDKPPHLRSKKPLKLVNITEIPIGETDKKSKTVNSEILIETSTRKLDTKARGDSNINNIIENNNRPNTKVNNKGTGDYSKLEEGDSIKVNSDLIINDNERKKIFNNSVDTVTNNFVIVESKKLHNDLLLENEKIEEDYKLSVKPPVSTVQFNTEWARLKAYDGGRSYYLSLIDPKNIPTIFQNSLDSNILSEIIAVLQQEKEAVKLKSYSISSYLMAITCVRRFGALALFMSDQDKKAVADLLEYCKLTEGCPENVLNDLKTKFEL